MIKLKPTITASKLKYYSLKHPCTKWSHSKYCTNKRRAKACETNFMAANVSEYIGLNSIIQETKGGLFAEVSYITNKGKLDKAVVYLFRWMYTLLNK